MLNFVDGRLFNFLNSNFNFLIRGMTRFGIRNRKLTEEERSVYKKMFNTKSKRKQITSMLHQLVDAEDLLTGIQKAFESTFRNIPALIIYGSKDPLVKFGIPERINKLLPASELHYIENEMHFPHEGDPGKMNELIIEWMKKKLL